MNESAKFNTGQKVYFIEEHKTITNCKVVHNGELMNFSDDGLAVISCSALGRLVSKMPKEIFSTREEAVKSTMIGEKQDEPLTEDIPQ